MSSGRGQGSLLRSFFLLLFFLARDNPIAHRLILRIEIEAPTAISEPATLTKLDRNTCINATLTYL